MCLEIKYLMLLNAELHKHNFHGKKLLIRLGITIFFVTRWYFPEKLELN